MSSKTLTSRRRALAVFGRDHPASDGELGGGGGGGPDDVGAGTLAEGVLRVGSTSRLQTPPSENERQAQPDQPTSRMASHSAQPNINTR
jgi:hypothetical protein